MEGEKKREKKEGPATTLYDHLLRKKDKTAHFGRKMLAKETIPPAAEERPTATEEKVLNRHKR